MRHALDRLLRAIRPDDGEDILGDIEQEYRARLHSSRGRFGADAWYVLEILAAVAYGARDGLTDWAAAFRRMDGGHARSISRLFRTHASYVVMSAVVLASSIGVNLLVFTVVNALWFRPLPYPDAHRVVTIPQETFVALDGPVLPVFDGSVTFEGGTAGQVITHGDFAGLRVPIDVGGRSLETLGVTSSYFDVLRLAVLGRGLTADDDVDGAEPVAIISDRLWSRAFGRRTEVIGSIVPAAPVPIRIVGVAPAGFAGARRGEHTDIWIPATLVRALAPSDWHRQRLPMMLLARLGPGQTASAIERQYRELIPRARVDTLRANNLSWALPTVTPLTDVFGSPDTRTLIVGANEESLFLVVAALATLVLLGGCATIAALVLIHYERRRGELALKISLGAGRRRLILEQVRDLSWVGAVGCAGGILVAALGVRMVPALSLPGGIDIGRLDLSIDWRIAAVAMAATGLTLLLAAALPVARSTRLGLARELYAGPTATLGSLRTRQRLLGLQVCATVVVLIAAGLFVRTVLYGFGGATGFDVDRTVFVSVQEGAPRPSGGDPRTLIRERSSRLVSILREVPGVNDVAEGIAPIGPAALAMSPESRTVQVHDREHDVLVGVLHGSPTLLATLGVPILAGRALAAEDFAGMPQPVVITESLASRLWPDGDVLGQMLSMPQSRPGGPFLIVGIARDFAFGSLTRPVRGAVVMAGTGSSTTASSFVVHTEHPDAVSALIRRTVEGQVVQARTGREIVAQDIGRQRLGAWFFSGFGLAALFLGISSAFGLVAYLAESQRHDFGVRVALGANLWDLVRHALSAGVIPVAAGVAAGLALGGAASQAFRALLVGVGTVDVVTYLAVAITMLGCATTAALAAAWRLRRTSPADALRTR